MFNILFSYHIAKIRLCYDISNCVCVFNIRLTYQRI
nr:MAG TPA: hypothetical protein [Bacteriophage sp.]